MISSTVDFFIVRYSSAKSKSISLVDSTISSSTVVVLLSSAGDLEIKILSPILVRV